MLNIAIAGAGPVGCTLARLILISPISSQVKLTIFEKDQARTSRTSLGGTLDLHPKTGLAAVEAMDLMESFKRHARYEGEEMRVCDLNGFTYFHATEAPNIDGFDARPEIDRVKLMDVLMQGVLDLDPEIIKWGKAVKEVKGAGRQWVISFEDGTQAGPFDLVIGADGAWSKVRNVLTDVKPSYSGASIFAGVIDQESAGADWEKISNMVGKGNSFSVSYGQSVILQRMGDGSVKSSFSSMKELSWIEEFRKIHGSDDEAVRLDLHERYKAWAEDFHLCISASKGFWYGPLWELPIGHCWKHRHGVTCIGDSAHLMTPFAGEGVNAGMRDALDLFKCLKGALTDKVDFDMSVKEFEESMFLRSVEFMKDTEVNKIGMHAQDAPYSTFVEMLESGVRQSTGHDLSSGWKSYLWWPIRSTIYNLLWCMGTYGALRRRLKGK